MQKQIGSIFLIAGTCIGSGMIALPLVLAKLGLIASFMIMILTWALCYLTALANLELNLQANQALPLGALCHYFKETQAAVIGGVALKTLTYSLVAVYIYGGSSITQELFKYWGYSIDFISIATGLSILTIGILFLPLKWVERVNSLLFLGFIGLLAFLLIGLGFSIPGKNYPLWPSISLTDFSWMTLLPVVFTSFGFQVIFHTVIHYCGNNKTTLKRVFLYGSFIPALVYMIWTGSILTLVYTHSPEQYALMVDGKMDIGPLISHLTTITNWSPLQLMIWWMSILAIVTSLIGVGLGLLGTWKTTLNEKYPAIVPILLTVLPSYFLVITVPNAFISILKFAGIILAIIAIFIPFYMLKKLHIKKESFFYPILSYPIITLVMIMSGVLFMIVDLF